MRKALYYLIIDAKSRVDNAKLVHRIQKHLTRIKTNITTPLTQALPHQALLLTLSSRLPAFYREFDPP